MGTRKYVCVCMSAGVCQCIYRVGQRELTLKTPMGVLAWSHTHEVAATISRSSCDNVRNGHLFVDITVIKVNAAETKKRMLNVRGYEVAKVSKLDSL